MISFEMGLNTCLLIAYVAAGVVILEGFDVRRRGRRSALYALLLLALFAGNLLMLEIWGLARYERYIPLFILLPLLFMTRLISRYRGIKMVFVYLTALIWTSPLLLAAHAVSLLCAPTPPVKLIVYAALAAPMLFLLKRYFRGPLLYLLDNYHRGWAQFCAVPFLCVLVSYFQTRYRFLSDVQTFRTTGLWQFALSLLAFLTYLLIVMYARQIRERLEAKAANQLLETHLQGALQNISVLRQSQRQAALYVHDLRHHLRYIHSLASEGSASEIAQYVVSIEQSIDASMPQAFCRNETVNLLLSSFRAQAERRGVTLEIRADIPEKLAIPDADLCVILANALENAVKAAGAVTDRQKLVEFAVHTRNGQLFIEIANPFTGGVRIEGDVVRSEDGREGLGTKSIALMVEKHGGICSFEAQDGRFVLRAIL